MGVVLLTSGVTSCVTSAMICFLNLQTIQKDHLVFVDWDFCPCCDLAAHRL